MTLDEAKAYLRLETTHDDALVEGLVASARNLCEAYLGRTLIRRTVTDTLRADGYWHRLGTAPVASITTVERVARDATTAPLAVDDYAIDIDPAGEGWIRATGSGEVRVTYRAGLADTASEVPAAIAQGVVRLAAHLYIHRDGVDAAPPIAVAALWRPFRRLRVFPGTRA